MDIYDFRARLGNGADKPLADYHGKVLLVVNVASQCGFTPQYTGLQDLYTALGLRGLEILAFPCDQFGHQEPGTDAEIGAFCTRNFGVTFPVFAKVDVNGKHAHPLFIWLKQQKRGWLGGAVRWNFTKFLVDRSGVVAARFAPTTTPEKLTGALTALL